jgi:flagellar biosynthetic protein FliR
MLWIRLSALLLLSPIFSGLGGMAAVRVLATLTLAVALVPAAGGRYGNMPMTIGDLLPAVLAELATGAVLAFGVFAAFGAFSVAGKVLDIQSGFGIGSVFDPVTRAGAPLFATMLNLLAVTVFFSMDGHHALLRGIAFSVQQVPLGTSLPALPADAVFRQFGMMFSLGTALIAPVMFCLFLVEAAMAFVSRVLPQMNMFVVGVPVKIAVCLLMLAATIGTIGPVMKRIYAAIFTYWEQVLR